MTIHRSENIISEVVDSLVMDIMLDFQPAGGCAVGRVDGGVPDVLGILNQGWVVIQISCCIQVEVCAIVRGCFEEMGGSRLTCHMISKGCQTGTAGCVASRVWRSRSHISIKVNDGFVGVDVPHISWEVAQNIVEGHLIVDHLLIEMCGIERCQILMGPSV